MRTRPSKVNASTPWDFPAGEKTYPNRFVHESAAERYDRARPYFHPVVIQKIRDQLRLHQTLGRALDVGCGTGQSSLALQGVANQVIGIDPSLAMLARWPAAADIPVAAARAEQLPFAGRSFDLITVALAFHWVKRARFLPEAFRVLKPGGWVAIYNNGFAGKMLDDPVFSRWNQNRSLKSVPIPPRYRYPLKEEQVTRHGLEFAHRENYENEVRFTRESLADYLLTQSNVIAEVEEKTAADTTAAHALRVALLEELAPLFPRTERSFLFGGSIWYLRKPVSPPQ